MQHRLQADVVIATLRLERVDDGLDAVELTRELMAQQPSVGVLGLCETGDDVGVTARKLHDALTCRKAFVKFKAAAGAGDHCEVGARAVFHRRAFDWLDGVLGHLT